MKELYEKQKELLNKTNRTYDTKTDSKNDLQKILDDSKLDKTNIKNNLIDELQDNIDKRFSVDIKHDRINNNFNLKNIDMMSSSGMFY